MFLPLLSYGGDDFASHAGLRQLFIFGRSSCGVAGDASDSFCNPSHVDWISEDGWNDLLRKFVDASRKSEESDLERKLLWLYIPDWKKNGMMSEIKSIPDLEGNDYWTESADCAGYEVAAECGLRVDEMALVNFSPYVCNDGEAR